MHHERRRAGLFSINVRVEQKAWKHLLRRTEEDLPMDDQAFDCSNHFKQECFNIAYELKMKLVRKNSITKNSQDGILTQM